jgi:hypothetical protein
MTTTIITIPVSAVPTRATYIAHVLQSGHRPGVLSGAELRGKARLYAGSYCRSRDKAAVLAAAYGVTQDLILGDNRRWTRVWTVDGAPVRITLSAANS